MARKTAFEIRRERVRAPGTSSYAKGKHRFNRLEGSGVHRLPIERRFLLTLAVIGRARRIVAEFPRHSGATGALKGSQSFRGISRHERVAMSKIGEPSEVSVGRPQLTDAVFETQGRHTGIVNLRARNSPLLDDRSQLLPV